jgi:4-hydroxy-3-methylbut-2-en-1-yl diphosphate synthase IspG/GcpE
MTCPEQNRLRFAWYDSLKETDLAKLKIHFRVCPVCSRERAEMTEYSRTAAMPEMSITEMETA